jgi:hypothetical protein
VHDHQAPVTISTIGSMMDGLFYDDPNVAGENKSVLSSNSNPDHHVVNRQEPCRPARLGYFASLVSRENGEPCNGKSLRQREPSLSHVIELP